MRKINIQKFLFYFSYILWLIRIMCERVSFITPIINYIQIIIVVILIILAFLNMRTFNIKTLILVILTLSIMIISYKITKFADILYTGLFILASKNIDKNKHIKIDLYLKIFLMGTIFMLYFLGCTSGGMMIRDDGTIRNSFGFSHPNILGLFLFSISCNVFYLKYDKFRINHYVILVVAFLISLYVCDSRSSQICIILLLFLSFFGKRIKDNKLIDILFKNLPLALFLISLFFTLIYPQKSNLILKLDHLLSTRIRRSSEFLNYYGVNLFGHYFEYYGQWSKGYYLTTLDNGYMHILIHYGIFIFTIFLIGFKKLLMYAKRTKNYPMYFVIVVFLFYGLMERHIFEIQYNPYILFLGCIIFVSKEKIYEEEKNAKENRNNNNK